MIIMNKKDGTIIPFIYYEFLDSNTLKLIDGNTEYTVTCTDIKSRLYTGNSIKDPKNIKLPVIYDAAAHGPLTNESMIKFGVEVIITSVLDVGVLTSNIIKTKRG